MEIHIEEGKCSSVAQDMGFTVGTQQWDAELKI